MCHCLEVDSILFVCSGGVRMVYVTPEYVTHHRGLISKIHSKVGKYIFYILHFSLHRIHVVIVKKYGGPPYKLNLRGQCFGHTEAALLSEDHATVHLG